MNTDVFILFEAKNCYIVSSDLRKWTIKADTEAELVKYIFGFLKAEYWIRQVYYYVVRGRHYRKPYIRGIVHAIFWLAEVNSNEVEDIAFQKYEEDKELQEVIKDWKPLEQRVAYNAWIRRK